MKKVIVKKFLTLATAICLSFTSAQVVAPQVAITAHAAGKISNPTPLQPDSNTDFSGPWTTLNNKEVDCYKVVLPADGELTVTLMQQNAFCMKAVIRKAQNLDYSSYVDHAIVFCDVENSPRTHTVKNVLSAGTYFITIHNEDGGLKYGSKEKHQYKLKTTYESFGVSETPDSYDSPKSLSLGTTYTDAITKTDNEDWYKVTITENKKYAVKLAAFQNQVKFAVKDSDLHVVSSRICDANKIDTGYVFLTAGIYYLHIDGGPSKYTVSLDSVNISMPSISKVKAVKNKKVDVSFKPLNDVQGYEIRYSTDKNFNKNVKTKDFDLSKTRFGNSSKRIYTISKLKKHKKYYFQIRSYVENNNVRYYSEWSKAKKVKVK